MKNKTFITFLLFFIIVLMQSACAKNELEIPAEELKPVFKDYDSVCLQENDDKIIETVGFIDDDKKGIFCHNWNGFRACSLELRKSMGDEKGLSVHIPVGKSKNTIEDVLVMYEKDKVVMRDYVTLKIYLGEKTKLTGKMFIRKDKNVCFMEVTKIEKLWNVAPGQKTN